MKIKRYKKVNRAINFYINNYGFRKPYQMLIDGTFCYAALNNQINIADNLPRYLQSELKLLTTQCALIETEKLGLKLGGALAIQKNYSLHKCGHEGNPVTATKCFLTMLKHKNEKHYIVATQDRDLQEKLRKIPGVPLIYLHTKTPVLENPSPISIKDSEKRKSGLFGVEVEKIEEMKEKVGIVKEEKKVVKKKKIKGPNPLSCKKKKKREGVAGKVEKKDGGVKKRKKVRIPEHAKEFILSQVKKKVK